MFLTTNYVSDLSSSNRAMERLYRGTDYVPKQRQTTVQISHLVALLFTQSPLVNFCLR